MNSAQNALTHDQNFMRQHCATLMNTSKRPDNQDSANGQKLVTGWKMLL